MYAILKPDGSLHRVVNAALPGGSDNYAAFGVLPVNQTIPEGFSRTGWQIVEGICEPVLVENPAPGPAPIPQEVTRRQFFLAVHASMGLTRTQLRAAIESEAGLIDFDEAQTFRRDYPLLSALAAQLGYTSEQIDQLFQLANTL